MSAESSHFLSSDHLDWDNAMKGVSGDSELLQELVQIFLDEVPSWLDELRRSIAAGEVDASRRVAHTMKGALSQLAMSFATDLAQRLENCCRDGQFDMAATGFKDFEVELAMLRPHLLRYVESTHSS